MLEIRSHADCHDHAASACDRIKTSWLGMVLISTSLSFFLSFGLWDDQEDHPAHLPSQCWASQTSSPLFHKDGYRSCISTSLSVSECPRLSKGDFYQPLLGSKDSAW